MKNLKRGFSLIEILVACSLTVLIATSITMGVNSIISCRERVLSKEQQASQAFVLIDNIENSIDKKCPSLGNWLINELSYPFQYKENFPQKGDSSLAFFVRTDDGPCLVAFICSHLPTTLGGISDSDSPRGLFQIRKSISESSTIFSNFSSSSDLLSNFSATDCSLFNLLSDEVVSLRIKLITSPVKHDNSLGNSDRLKYIELADPSFLIYSGKIYSGTSTDSVEFLEFLDISVNVLGKDLHEQYFNLTLDSEKKNFLTKRGYTLSRIIPWRI